MRMRPLLLSVVLGVLGIGIGVLFAGIGTTDSPGIPDDPASASYTLEDLYNRLTTGADGSQTTFTEPVTDPGIGTMHTLNQSMAAAPAQDNTDGAIPGDVLGGKTFWSLRTDGSGGSVWGPSVGSMPTRTVDSSTVAQQAGYYNAHDLSVADPDLAAGNIRSGATVYGISGTWDGPTRVVTSHGSAGAGSGVYLSVTCPAGWTRSDWVCGVKAGILDDADIAVDLHCFIAIQKCECTVWNNEAFALPATLMMVCD